MKEKILKITFLLILALVYLFSAEEEALPFSGEFNTIYLAGKSVKTTAENSQARMLMREVMFFNEFNIMGMTFYVRKNGLCQLYTVWADKCPQSNDEVLLPYSTRRYSKTDGTDHVPTVWKLRRPTRHFPKLFYDLPPEEGKRQRPSEFLILIYFVSNTTILFEASFRKNLNYFENLTGALATGTNITQEMWEQYVKLTEQLNIPTKNIKNIYKRDTCPKWNP